jgi:hypothetical protein
LKQLQTFSAVASHFDARPNLPFVYHIQLKKHGRAGELMNPARYSGKGRMNEGTNG